MKWSVKFGRLAGIDVYIHTTFFVLLAWVAFIHWRQNESIGAALIGVVFILAIFACVVMHELGHALMAKTYGIKTRDIILLPIGGVARLEKMPDKPLQELWVALAGPAVNVVIVLILSLLLYISNSFVSANQLTLTTGSLLERILAVNIFLVAFNMIPAFPMDGGRVLRALLATRMEYTRATKLSATLGQSFALLFGVVGLFFNPLLLLIAIFVWIGAAQETRMTQMKSALGGIPVSQAMLTDFRSIGKRDTLQQAIALTLSSSQKDFPVVENGSIEGVLTQNDLLSAVNKQGQHLSVSEAMKKNFMSVESMDKLETAFNKLKACKCDTLPVLRNGRLVGLLTMDKLAEFVRFRSALQHQN